MVALVVLSWLGLAVHNRIRAHVQLCCLARLLIRVVENATGDTWRNIARELDRMHLVTLATHHGTVAQRSATTPEQKSILTKLDLPEPPRFFDFTLPPTEHRPTAAASEGACSNTTPLAQNRVCAFQPTF